MNEATCRIAFTEWLEATLDRLLRAPSFHEDFLGRAVDHADLERRLRVVERGAPYLLFR